MFKKIISGVLSAVVSCGIILSDAPAYLQKETPSAPADKSVSSEQVKLMGSNSLGSFIADSASRQDENHHSNLPAAAVDEVIHSVINLGFDNEPS